mmetsp:Transcript_47257/g.34551  ORF Transcript_47257/g.34551 Transcript_47257/m.34551 type:complete len:147 (+) Transcript_47257:135-575(+)
MKKVVKNFDGSSYAMINLELKSKEIDELGDVMRLLVNVRYLDISDNLLTDITDVVFLPNLIKLDAQKNFIESLAFLANDPPFKFLNDVNLSKNRVKKMSEIKLPPGARINLNENLLETLDGFSSNPLEVLELRKNKLVNIKGLRDT